MSGQDLTEDEVRALRVDLAAAFRLAVRFGWHESVGNHFSAAVSSDGKRFLMNPKWRHFGDIRASDLQLLDADDPSIMETDAAPDASAWCIHGTVHRMRPNARVMLHLHPPHTTALATLKDPRLYPIDQNTARFYHMGVDLGFAGIADEVEEGERIARVFGNHDVLMMGNHGLSVIADTVAEAFEQVYFFEKAAETQMRAYASGQPLNVMSDEIAAKTAASWADYNGTSFAHFDYLKRQLDRSEPEYAN